MNYLGMGLTFPIQLTASGAWQKQSGEALIIQSIHRLLSTPQGTRFYLPEYGSRLHELLFVPNDTIVIQLLKTFITDAITAWEGRVKVVGVQVESFGNRLDCQIQCKILQSNEIISFIYPYYRNIVF